MQRDPDLHRRSELGWWLGGVAVGVAVGAALPIDWWAKLLIALGLAVVFLALRFLLTRVPPLPEARWTGSRMTVCEKGANSADPNTSRVLIEFAAGDVHTHYVLPPGADPLPAFLETVKTVSPNVRSVRAMKGLDEVRRWHPSFATRIARAWRRAAAAD